MEAVRPQSAIVKYAGCLSARKALPHSCCRASRGPDRHHAYGRPAAARSRSLVTLVAVARRQSISRWRRQRARPGISREIMVAHGGTGVATESHGWCRFQVMLLVADSER